MAGADPKTIDRLIKYARHLITEGEDVRGKVIQARDDAVAENQAALAALKKASDFLVQSKKEEKQARDTLAFNTAKEASTRKDMDDAEVHRKKSQAKFDHAQATMVTELARIAKEDADLKEVKGLLEELMPVFIEKSLGRALLSEVDQEIDPKALQKIIDLVVKLIAAGQQDARDYTKKRDDARKVLDLAIEDHENKIKVHTHWLGAKSVAEDILEEKIAQTAKATHDKALAVAAQKSTAANAADAEKHRVSEEKRIDEERALFNKVISLLQGLKAQ